MLQGRKYHPHFTEEKTVLLKIEKLIRGITIFKYQGPDQDFRCQICYITFLVLMIFLFSLSRYYNLFSLTIFFNNTSALKGAFSSMWFQVASQVLRGDWLYVTHRAFLDALQNMNHFIIVHLVQISFYHELNLIEFCS